jgi:hypothetical protein
MKPKLHANPAWQASFPLQHNWFKSPHGSGMSLAASVLDPPAPGDPSSRAMPPEPPLVEVEWGVQRVMSSANASAVADPWM